MDLHARRVNGWLGLALLAATVGAGLVAVAVGDPLWVGFSLLVVVLAGLPAVLTRDPLALPPWELLALAALPAVAHAVTPWVGSLALSAATYLAVAALALLVVATLDRYDGATLSPPYAAGFVAVTTMAVAAVWTLARYAVDLFTAVDSLPAEDALMADLVLATTVGVVAGVVVEGYLAVAAVESLAGLAPPVADDGGEDPTGGGSA